MRKSGWVTIGRTIRSFRALCMKECIVENTSAPKNVLKTRLHRTPNPHDHSRYEAFMIQKLFKKTTAGLKTRHYWYPTLAFDIYGIESAVPCLGISLSRLKYIITNYCSYDLLVGGSADPFTSKLATRLCSNRCISYILYTQKPVLFSTV